MDNLKLKTKTHGIWNKAKSKKQGKPEVRIGKFAVDIIEHWQKKKKNKNMQIKSDQNKTEWRKRRKIRKMHRNPFKRARC